jgi:hypothetical protein
MAAGGGGATGVREVRMGRGYAGWGANSELRVALGGEWIVDRRVHRRDAEDAEVQGNDSPQRREERKGFGGQPRTLRLC